jgi:uncharacterized protein (TIGR00369 family)
VRAPSYNTQQHVARQSNWIRQNPYAADLGVKLEAADAASARFSLRHEERNAMAGSLHGGAIASLISIATRAVVHASAPAKTPLCTASMHVDYVRAARKSLTVEARLRRRVRELAFFETRMEDEGGDLVAFASSVVSEGRTAVAGASPTAVRDALRPESLSPNANTEAIHEATAAIPFLSRRQLRIEEVAGGRVGVAIGPATVNLDGDDGCMDEGALLTLIDAAGATCPWTIASPSSGVTGATIALTAQVLGPLPKGGLVAHAAIRAQDGRLYWSDVTISDSHSRQVHAFGTVLYRFSQRDPS